MRRTCGSTGSLAAAGASRFGTPAAALDHLATGRRIIDETGYYRRDGELAALEGEAHELAKAAPPPHATPTHVPSPPPSAPTPTKPMPEPSATQHVDVGVVIALPEELREFLAIAGDYTRHPAADLDTYILTRRPDREPHRPHDRFVRHEPQQDVAHHVASISSVRPLQRR